MKPLNFTKKKRIEMPYVRRTTFESAADVRKRLRLERAEARAADLWADTIDLDPSLEEYNPPKESIVEAFGVRWREEHEDAIAESRLAGDVAECVICMEDKRDSICVPCGHAFFCEACIAEHLTAQPDAGCPMCRKPIITVIRLFR